MFWKTLDVSTHANTHTFTHTVPCLSHLAVEVLVIAGNLCKSTSLEIDFPPLV